MPRLAVIALTTALLSQGCGCARTAKETATAAPPTAAVKGPSVKTTSVGDARMTSSARGMWVWSTKSRLADPGGVATLLDTCRKAKLNEVYLSVNNGALDDRRLPELMGALRDAGVRVEALMGDAVWYRPESRAPMFRLIEEVAAYSEAHRGAGFAGVHLDIEPHQIPENRGDHRFLPALAETVEAASELAARRGLATSMDLPRFALDEEGPRFARVNARPFVMLYQLRDRSSAWLVKQSGSVVKHTFAGAEHQPTTGRLVVGLRVEDYASDLEERLGALDDAHGESQRYGGWAVHDEAKFRARHLP